MTHTDETHESNVEAVRQGIVNGQVYQVNIGKHWQEKSTTRTPSFNASCGPILLLFPPTRKRKTSVLHSQVPRPNRC